MNAPVYRNIESKTSFAGIGLEEALFVMAVTMVLLMVMRHNEAKAVAIGGALYGAILLLNAGRAPSFVQHWFAFRLRGLLGRGRLSAAARSRAPRFPHAPYISLDLPPMETTPRGSVAR